jgi:hypothetical protein
MPDGKQPCASCPHPFAEHGAHGTACKVPGCSCSGYVSGGGDSAQAEAPPGRHTVVGRATDADGNQGIEMKLPNGEGNPLSVGEEAIRRFGEEIDGHYKRIFGKAPEHLGVTALPYLASADRPLEQGQDGVPMLLIGEDAEPEDVVQTLKTIDDLGLSVEHMPTRHQLAYALKDICAEDAARAAKGGYEDGEAQEGLATKLAQMEDPSGQAYLLASRLRGGQFR